MNNLNFNININNSIIFNNNNLGGSASSSLASGSTLLEDLDCAVEGAKMTDYDSGGIAPIFQRGKTDREIQQMAPVLNVVAPSAKKVQEISPLPATFMTSAFTDIDLPIGKEDPSEFDLMTLEMESLSVPSQDKATENDSKAEKTAGSQETLPLKREHLVLRNRLRKISGKKGDSDTLVPFEFPGWNEKERFEGTVIRVMKEKGIKKFTNNTQIIAEALRKIQIKDENSESSKAYLNSFNIITRLLIDLDIREHPLAKTLNDNLDKFKPIR